jgi:DNA-binding NarL/FixJ family response regulator
MTIRVVIADDQAMVRAGFRSLLNQEPDIEVLGEAADGEQAVAAGASGFLLKDASPEQLIAAIHVINEGEAVLAPSVTRRVVEAFSRFPARQDHLTAALEKLTAREREVLELLAKGSSNLEVARALFVSETTAKTHVRNVLAKLDLRDRVHAVVFAYESGLVRPGGP